MKIGDLIKHKTAHTTAIVLDIYMKEGLDDPEGYLTYPPEEYAEVLFSSDALSTRAPFKLLQENWEVISEI